MTQGFCSHVPTEGWIAPEHGSRTHQNPPREAAVPSRGGAGSRHGSHQHRPVPGGGQGRAGLPASNSARGPLPRTLPLVLVPPGCLCTAAEPPPPGPAHHAADARAALSRPGGSAPPLGPCVLPAREGHLAEFSVGEAHHAAGVPAGPADGSHLPGEQGRRRERRDTARANPPGQSAASRAGRYDTRPHRLPVPERIAALAASAASGGAVQGLLGSVVRGGTPGEGRQSKGCREL